MPGFILDLDGTLYRGRTAIAYAASFIHMLQNHQLPYVLMTNNSSRTPEEIAAHLLPMGIRVSPEHIFTSSQATAMYMQQMNHGQTAFVIGEHGLKHALLERGFTVYEEENEHVEVDFVVQGIDRSINYQKLSYAIQHIMSGAKFINTNPDQLLPSEKVYVPGAGTFAAAIQYATNVTPIVIGKPSSIIFEFAVQILQCPPHEIWVIGDNASTDIRGGEVIGCKTALVLTGITTRDNLEHELTRAHVTPDLVCEDLRQFAETLDYSL